MFLGLKRFKTCISHHVCDDTTRLFPKKCLYCAKYLQMGTLQAAKRGHQRATTKFEWCKPVSIGFNFWWQWGCKTKNVLKPPTYVIWIYIYIKMVVPSIITCDFTWEVVSECKEIVGTTMGTAMAKTHGKKDAMIFR